MAKAKSNQNEGLVDKIRQQPLKYALPLLAVLLAVQAYFWMSEQEPPLPELKGANLYLRRIQAVQGAADTFKAEHGRLPTGGREIYKMLGKERKYVPLVQTKEVELFPDAVVYLRKDGTYQIKAIDASGAVFALNGKPMIVTR